MIFLTFAVAYALAWVAWVIIANKIPHNSKGSPLIYTALILMVFLVVFPIWYPVMKDVECPDCPERICECENVVREKECPPCGNKGFITRDGRLTF